MTAANLSQLAILINRTYGEVKANYIGLGKLLIMTKARVKLETKLSWAEWCAKNLRKRDGKPFSVKTLENYVYLARHPAHLENQRRLQRENIRKIRYRAKSSMAVDSIFDKGLSHSDQVNILMTCWERAEESAREQFLELIGAKL